MSPDERAESYVRALEETAPAAVRLDPEVEEEAFSRFAALFRDMDPDKVHALVPHVYAHDAYLNDNLDVVVGADSIELYLAEASSGDRDVSFELRDTAVSRDGADYYVRWEMELMSPGLNDGEPVRTAGSSHLRFDADGRIVLHRDFWDTAEGFYERIPVLGWLIGRARDRV